MKKVQVVLDDESVRLLDELARPRAGNKSFVVREALRYYHQEHEAMERLIDALEQDPEWWAPVEEGLRQAEAGQTVPHDVAMRLAAEARRKGLRPAQVIRRAREWRKARGR